MSLLHQCIMQHLASCLSYACLHKSVNPLTYLRGSQWRGKFLSRCIKIVISDSTGAIYIFRFSITVFHAKVTTSVIYGLRAKEALRSLIQSFHISNKKNETSKHSVLYPQSPSALLAESELSSDALPPWSGVLSAWGQVACILILSSVLCGLVLINKADKVKQHV